MNLLSNFYDSGKKGSRNAIYFLFAGIIFSALFTVLIWVFGPNLNHFIQTFLPYQGGFWYYWKLPVRNFWSMAIVWSFYIINQILVWWAIIWAQRNLSKQKVNPTYDITK